MRTKTYKITDPYKDARIKEQEQEPIMCGREKRRLKRKLKRKRK